MRPHGDAWNDLVFRQWWTKKDGLVSDRNGAITFEGFLGTYRYTVVANGKTQSGTFELGQAKESGQSNAIRLAIPAR